MPGNKKIVLTGGGSAGHVTPNLALISGLRRLGWEIHYIGSAQGIEKEIIENTGVPFHPIASGKLRRYFDWKNFQDPFKVLAGVFQAYCLIKKLKPHVIFSKGGFVSVPVVIGGWLNRIPVVIHESDMTPGLANKLAQPFASKICITFPETLSHVAANKAVRTGLPIRQEILAGNRTRGLDLCRFHRNKPVLLVMGGSLGSRAINEVIRANLPLFLSRYQVVHICGKKNADPGYSRLQGYCQFEYIAEELPHILAMADIVVSRAGATSLNEFLALKKPMVLIPLTLQASRGDQLLNARSFEASGYGKVLEEEHLTGKALFDLVCEVYERREDYIARMSRSENLNGTDAILRVIERLAVQNR